MCDIGFGLERRWHKRAHPIDAERREMTLEHSRDGQKARIVVVEGRFANRHRVHGSRMGGVS